MSCATIFLLYASRAATSTAASSPARRRCRLFQRRGGFSMRSVVVLVVVARRRASGLTDADNGVRGEDGHSHRGRGARANDRWRPRTAPAPPPSSPTQPMTSTPTTSSQRQGWMRNARPAVARGGKVSPLTSTGRLTVDGGHGLYDPRCAGSGDAEKHFPAAHPGDQRTSRVRCCLCSGRSSVGSSPKGDVDPRSHLLGLHLGTFQKLPKEVVSQIDIPRRGMARLTKGERHYTKVEYDTAADGRIYFRGVEEVCVEGSSPDCT